MKRVVIDLTEFNSWSGHLTGVQRVSYGLASSFADSDTDVRFVTYDGGSAFLEVDYAEIIALFKKQEEQQQSSVRQAVQEGRLSKSEIKKAAKAVYHRLPNFVKDKITPERKDRIIRKAKAAYSRLQGSPRAVFAPSILKTKSSTPFEFNKDDVLVSSCRVWDHPKYIKTLKAIKSQTQLKLALVIYDLIPIYQQHTFGPGLTERYSRYLFDTLNVADYLLPISASSKKDLLRYAQDLGIINLPTIEVIRLGDDIANTASNKVPEFVKKPDSFAVTVGTIEARKNHAEIYYAYKLAVEKNISLPELYIVGKPGWLTGDIIYAIENDNDVNQKLKIVHNVTDDELAWLYSNALFTVYPSQYEGWGLPIAESLAYNTPCIASFTSSMAEIAPDYVDHVSPFDPAQMLERMGHFTSKENSKQKRAVISKGYKPYTWLNTREAVINILKKS